MFFSTPFCTGYAYHASRHAAAMIPARIGLFIAGAELLVLVALMVVGMCQ